jgi:hypothetical protein
MSWELTNSCLNLFYESRAAVDSNMATAAQRPEYFSLVRSEIETILPDHIGSVLEIGCARGATMAWLRSIRSVEYAMGDEVISEVAAQARAVFDDVIVGSVWRGRHTLVPEMNLAIDDQHPVYPFGPTIFSYSKIR